MGSTANVRRGASSSGLLALAAVEECRPPPPVQVREARAWLPADRCPEALRSEAPRSEPRCCVSLRRLCVCDWRACEKRLAADEREAAETRGSHADSRASDEALCSWAAA
eukprot:CAMPEP_0115858384 /NCGR_PEP_ID=MMETSP0287-20121206/16068_1 /TAXON_ID=412157 /ORGANISM="Chrysochromulina rotalis, Strain UIO044" /LENGTH=109 /DNA_ID=CAMNT_0003312643 /DNA_START=407 /DNA_END=733 /DNA_ORIENTATION=-